MRDRSFRWVPPFCPNEACAFHVVSAPCWPWSRAGFYTRQASPQRIQRFHCGHCGRYFSRQTFEVSYWLKRPALLFEVFHALTVCTAFRQLARKLACSPQTVYHQALRLARHAQLFHELHRPKGELTEPLDLDGLQSFEHSQFHPSLYHVLVGQRSHFVYGFTHSELRRSGAMTARQRARRDELERDLGRPDPRSVEREVARLLGIVTAGSRHLELWSDEHPSYPRAIAALAAQRPLEVEHHTVSSRAARTPQNRLFAVNLLDLLLRHCCANHKRETIAFSKSTASGIARAWVFLAWRNFVKWFSERARDGTPAMRAGVAARRWSVRQVLAERLFPGRVTLPEPWREHYLGLVSTRRITHPRRHTLRYAT